MSDFKQRMQEARKRAEERERKQKIRYRLEFAVFIGSLILVWAGFTIWWALTWTP